MESSKGIKVRVSGARGALSASRPRVALYCFSSISLCVRTVATRGVGCRGQDMQRMA